MNQNDLEIFVQLEKEIQVDDQGIGSSSKRGLARMCGIDSRTWANSSGEYFTKELDKWLAAKGINPGEYFTEGGRILDVLCKQVIKFYSRKNDIADRFDDAFGTIGIRSTFQKVKGWQPKKDYSPYLLKEPRQWTKVFGDDFYDELSRLTGLDWDRKTHRKPCRFAYLTRYYVYDYLPPDVIATIKATQEEHGGYLHKMHQFLSPDGLEALKHHLVLCLNILEGASSLPEAKRSINQAVTKNYQLSLFEE